MRIYLILYLFEPVYLWYDSTGN